MPNIQDIFDQYIARSELLLNEGKLKDAYDLCAKVLETDPEYEPALKMKEKIAGSVQNVNQKAIDEKMKALSPLWEKGSYGEIIKDLTDLYRYAPHYEPLESALAQAQALYRGQVAAQQQGTLGEYKKQLEALLREKKYQEMIEMMQKRNRDALNDTSLSAAHELYRDKIIEQKIEEKRDLFVSEKNDDIVNFLYQLEQIDRKNKRVQDLLRKYRGDLLVSQVSDKQEFVLRATEKAKTLYQIGKYDKALQAAEEILEFDPSNTFARDMAKKAKSKYGLQLQSETENQITSSIETLQREHSKNPTGYIIM
jgi:tetratricopeptide (TPR) repeat protein